MKITIALLSLSLLAACGAGREKLAQPDGQVFRFNPERWEAALATPQIHAGAAR